METKQYKIPRQAFSSNTTILRSFHKPLWPFNLNIPIKVSHWQGDITFSNSFTWQDYPLYKTENESSLHQPGDLCVNLSRFMCEDARSMPSQLTDGWREQMLGMLGYYHLQVTCERLRTDQFVLTVDSLLTCNIWCLIGFYACVCTSLLVHTGRRVIHRTIWQAADTWPTLVLSYSVRRY